MNTGPYKPFTLEYDEGWAVFQTDRDDGTHLAIQCLDDPKAARDYHPIEPLFDSDDAAIAHVRKRAAEGSQYHQEAIVLHGKIMPYWSGSPDPNDPDNYWIDDETGERVNAHTGERSKS